MSKVTESLVGKTIVGLDVNQREEALRFRLADGTEVLWRTEGDCCSESWWADVTQANALRGAEVIEVVEANLTEPADVDARSRQESDLLYGYVVRTTKGTATLVFRNSSNGYYGGWCYLGVPDAVERYGRPIAITDEWREITGNDWSA